MVKYLKVVLKKEIDPDSSDYARAIALQNFIYDIGGCITGWAREISLHYTQNQVAYTCIGEYREADVDYLYEVWLERIKAEHYDHMTIIDNIDISGEATIILDSEE